MDSFNVKGGDIGLECSSICYKWRKLILQRGGVGKRQEGGEVLFASTFWHKVLIYKITKLDH